MAFCKKVKKKITGLWYPQVVTVGKPVTTDQVADRLALISTVSRGDTYAVLKDFGGVLHSGIDLRLYSAVDKSFWNCLFETVRLDIPYEGALKYVALLDEFYEAGWRKILCGNRPVGE